MLYEVRDYCYRRDNWDQYKAWLIEEALPYLRANLDLVGFWLDSGIETVVGGTDPDVSKHGSANVHWIIRWQDKEARDREFPRVLQAPDWQDIMSRNPDRDGYLQTTSRLMEDV